MASEVQICNRALIRLGADTITAITENSKEGRLCNTVYDLVRKDLLRGHPWNFSIKRVILASSTTTPDFEYDYKYQIPSDCLRVLDVYLPSSEFKIEGSYILTNDNTLSLIYISDVTDTTKFDSVFTSVLSLRVAIELCYNITGNSTMIESLKDEAAKLIREARLWDGQEGSAPQFTVYGWLDDR